MQVIISSPPGWGRSPNRQANTENRSTSASVRVRMTFTRAGRPLTRAAGGGPTRAVTGPCGAVGPHPGLVQPADLRPDPVSLVPDAGVHLGPPPGQVGRVLLVRPAGRPLRGEPVPSEPPAPHPPGLPDAEPPGRVLPDGRPSPQGVGQPEVVRVAGPDDLQQDRLLVRGKRSAAGFATPFAGLQGGRPGLYFDLLDHNIRGPDVVTFLAELHRWVGAVTVVWDRNNIHSRSKAVRAWLAEHPGVVAEDFPGYVPDLNPDEGVWGWTKYGRLANLAADDKDELWDRVVDELVEVKFRPDLLRGFVRQTVLPGVSLAA